MSSLNADSGHNQAVKRKPGPKRFSKILGVTGAASKENVRRDMMMTTTATATAEVKKGQLDQQESTQSQMKLQADRLDNLEEVIMVKVPLLEVLAQEVSNLRKEMETEREKDKGAFMKCIENLMEEVVQVNLKLLVLEERIEESEKLRLEAAATLIPAQAAVHREPLKSQSGSDVTEMISLLAEDNQAKFVEVALCQTSLQSEIDQVKSEMDYLTYVFTPPVEAILEASPEPPLGTPLLNLAKWGYENLNEMFPIPDDQIENKQADAVGEEEMPPKVIEVIDDSDPENGIDDVEDEPCGVTHKKAPMPGRYLPFLCQCSLEFDSEASLSEHVKEHTSEDSNGRTPLNSQAMDDDDCAILEPPMTKKSIPSDNPRTSRPITKSGEIFRRGGIHKIGHGKNGSKMGPRPKQPTSDFIPKLNSTRKVGSINMPGSSDKHGFQTISEDEHGHPKFHCKCGRSFCRKDTLQIHVHSTSGQTQRFKCNLCPKHYCRRFVLNAHMKRKHNVNLALRKGQMCSKCNQLFSTRKLYAEHRPNCNKINLN